MGTFFVVVISTYLAAAYLDTNVPRGGKWIPINRFNLSQYFSVPSQDP